MSSKTDISALYSIGYGLYIVTSRNGEKDNGLVVNTVMQVTDKPCRVDVTINKSTYSHDIIMKTGVMTVNCIAKEAPFAVFERFGFQSGRKADKLAGLRIERAKNGTAVLTAHVNAAISLEVEQYIDLDTQGMFICTVTEERRLSNAESMTYAYYHSSVKPKPKTASKKGFVCKICGYVYEGDTLPKDFICPLCKHGSSDFEPLEQE